MFNKVGMKATPLDIRRDRWKHVSGETRDFKVKYNDELLERKKSIVCLIFESLTELNVLLVIGLFITMYFTASSKMTGS
jgi:hypothetical protein